MISIEIKNRIIEFIKEGQTNEAVDLLVHSLENDSSSPEYLNAILISNRFHKLQNDTLIGLKTESSEMNEINHSILELLRSIKIKPNSQSTTSNAAAVVSGDKNGKELKLMLYSNATIWGIWLISYLQRDNISRDFLVFSATLGLFALLGLVYVLLTKYFRN